MSLHDYLESFRQAIEKIEEYGCTESVQVREEIRPNKQAVTTLVTYNFKTL